MFLTDGKYPLRFFGHNKINSRILPVEMCVQFVSDSSLAVSVDERSMVSFQSPESSLTVDELSSVSEKYYSSQSISRMKIEYIVKILLSTCTISGFSTVLVAQGICLFRH